MGDVLHTLTANPDSFMFLMIFGALGTVGLAAVVMATVAKVSSTRQREESRRQIAAYIADGSMAPEDGRRLLEADAVRDRETTGEAGAVSARPV